MARASFVLPDGTKVEVDGSPEEIKRILNTRSLPEQNVMSEAPSAESKPSSPVINLAEIVNKIKSCKEAELIERNILDRTSQVDKILMSLYIIHLYFPRIPGLSTGDIAKILSQFGIGILVSNISHTLSSSASKYVLGDRIRKKGQVVFYRISRKGSSYIGSVIKGKSNE